MAIVNDKTLVRYEFLEFLLRPGLTSLHRGLSCLAEGCKSGGKNFRDTWQAWRITTSSSLASHAQNWGLHLHSANPGMYSWHVATTMAEARSAAENRQ